MTPTIKRLESGYWHVRWNAEIWAQWPDGRPLQDADFFHDTATPQRIHEADALATVARSARGRGDGMTEPGHRDQRPNESE